MAPTDRKLVYKTAFIVGFLLASVILIYLIFHSSDGQAALGLLFIPYYGTIAGLTGVGLTYIYLAIQNLTHKRNHFFSLQTLKAILILFSLIGFSCKYGYEKYMEKIASDPLSKAEDLIKIDKAWAPFDKSSILYLVAKNPQTPVTLLEKYSRSTQRYLVSSVALNPKTPVTILNSICQQDDLYYERVFGLAGNSNTPLWCLKKLIMKKQSDNSSYQAEESLYDSQVLAPIAQRESLPQEYFDLIVERRSTQDLLGFAIVGSIKARCEHLKQYENHSNGVLKANALRRLENGNCLKL
jgi:hypothetical protein